MLKEVLAAALTKEQREAGLYLLYLFDRGGNRQAVFSSKGATIRDRADELIK